jgi:NADPH:quinone reductase-like Zn-dependent oxidoreductase
MLQPPVPCETTRVHAALRNTVAQLDAGGPDTIVIVQRPVARLEPSQVRVRVRAASLNHRDLLVIRRHPPDGSRAPLVPLSDCAGEVVEVGCEVQRFKIGDRVSPAPLPEWVTGPFNSAMLASSLGDAVDGVLAEYFSCDQHALVALSDWLSFEEAATLPRAALTAWNALFEQGDLKPGQTVLVQGSGGVSTFALQFAVAAGARVIATSCSDQKLERLRELGAAHGVNYRREPDWSRAVLEVTNGAGVDHVIETGGAGTLDQSIKATAVGGCISVIGVLSGSSGTVDVSPILKKTLRLQGIVVGSVEMFERMVGTIENLEIIPVIDRTFDMQDIMAAVRYFESGRHVGKIVLRVGGSV